MFNFTPKRARDSLDGRVQAVRQEIRILWPCLIAECQDDTLADHAQKVLSAVEHLHLALIAPPVDDEDTQIISVFRRDEEST